MTKATSGTPAGRRTSLLVRMTNAAREAGEATAMLEHVPPERRPFVWAGTPQQAANELQPYLDAGFTGFTFNNSIDRPTEQIALLGELLRIVEGVTAPA